MLDRNQIASASQTLHDHWRAGTKLDALDDWLRPSDRTEGYAIQAAIERYSTTHLFGWKIAATSEAGQKHINVDGPMAGRILAETVIPDGGTASMAGNEMRVAEPEFAFRMRTDLPARSTPYTMQQVLDAVDTLHPAIEIPIRASPISSAPARPAHRRQCLRASVRAGSCHDGGLARARSGRGEACDHAARRAVHRPRQKRARRSPACADLACE
jgi:2-keto-4-pentenoate hydratase